MLQTDETKFSFGWTLNLRGYLYCSAKVLSSSTARKGKMLDFSAPVNHELTVGGFSALPESLKERAWIGGVCTGFRKGLRVEVVFEREDDISGYLVTIAL